MNILIKKSYHKIQGLFQNFILNSISPNPKFIKNQKQKILICGNGPSLNHLIKNKSKFNDYDILMINLGPLRCSLNIKFHLFEIPLSEDEKGLYDFEPNEFKSYLTAIDSRVENLIYKSNLILNYFKLRKLNRKIFHIKKRRIVHYPKQEFVKNIISSINKNFVPYAKSSIVYAVFLAIKLGYKHIEFLGVNPQTKDTFYNKSEHKTSHETLKPDKNFNSYELIKIISKVDIFSEINFKVNENNGWNFL